MSGKLFWQIVILIIVASIVMPAAKFGLVCLKKQYCAKMKVACPMMASDHPREAQQQ